MSVEPPPSPYTRGLAAALRRLLAAAADRGRHDGREVPGAGELPEHDLVGVGADLSPGTLLAGYRCGLFPMGLGDGGAPPIGWWCPDPRGVLPLGELHVSRSLGRSLRGLEVRVDSAFAEVVAGCAAPHRSGRWITPEVAAAYRRLHELGWAHSVETWRDGELVGGLYGVAVGGLFAGESMFSQRPDASKAALVGLVELLRQDGDERRLLDVQWLTDHLASLGAVEVPRAEYLARLSLAVQAPLPPAWRPPAGPWHPRGRGGSAALG